MKKVSMILLLVILTAAVFAQPRNVVIITTDGLRWQEVFGGMDTAIANNKKFNENDSLNIFEKYWAEDANARRQKLMPFFWKTIAGQGSIYGNRHLGSRVDVANPHWFSYPGYSEIFTGKADEAINSNQYPPNPHKNLLEAFNDHPFYKGRIVAFGAWNAFDRILNEQRSGIPVYNAFDTVTNPKTANQQLINTMLLNSYRPWGDAECLDVFTHYAAMEYLKVNQPRLLYIAYGETDEWAHAGKYKSYLHAANQFDKWLGELWQYLQSHQQYKNNTYLFITTDHGRGDKVKSQWTDHGSEVEGASEIWFAEMGPGVKATGEAKSSKPWLAIDFANHIMLISGLK